jgi:hypothetical protein
MAGLIFLVRCGPHATSAERASSIVAPETLTSKSKTLPS